MINKSTISSERISLGEESFAVAARVAMQLGRESISNSIVAISELVKNAYDALDSRHWRHPIALGCESRRHASRSVCNAFPIDGLGG